MLPREALAFLAASPHRPQLLSRLAESPAGPAALVDALDCSRTSVHRHLSALADRGWVEKADGDYRLTAAGRYVHRSYDDCVTGLGAVERCRPLLASLPALEPPLEARRLAGGSLTVAREDTPHAPVEAYVAWLRDRIETAGRLRCVAPVLSGVFETPHEEAVDTGIRTDFLLPAALLEQARSADAEEVEANLRRPELSVAVLPDNPGYGLTVADATAFLGAYDDTGQMTAGFASERPAFRSWAAEAYETLAGRADPVEVGADAVPADG